MKATPVYGLVLAGGRSSRMHKDKAALSYHGRTQLEWAMSLIEPQVERAFVSVRPDQNDDPVRAHFAQIVDTRDNLGPIAGIMAAQAQYPDVAWLVLACDLPFLDGATITYLLEARRPERSATAFRSSHDGLPEPLCAIYEPASRDAIIAHVARGKDCPRKFLINADTQLIDEPDPRALDNINTPEEYGSAMATLSPDGKPLSSGASYSDGAAASQASTAASPSSAAARSSSAVASTPAAATRKNINVKVQYYAILREQAGRSDEALVTGARTPRELYDELKGRHSFSLAAEMLRVAVNAEFGEWSQTLADGDSVVFIPPVAGG